MVAEPGLGPGLKSVDKSARNRRSRGGAARQFQTLLVDISVDDGTEAGWLKLNGCCMKVCLQLMWCQEMVLCPDASVHRF